VSRLLDAEAARRSFLDRLPPVEQATVLRTVEVSGPGPRDPDWLIAEASAAAADRISAVVAALASSPLIVDEAQIAAAAVKGVNSALSASALDAVLTAAYPRIDAAVAGFEAARSWLDVMYATMFAVVILAAFALGEFRYVHDAAFSDGYRAAFTHPRNTNIHRP
jgi:hypothetical protein